MIKLKTGPLRFHFILFFLLTNFCLTGQVPCDFQVDAGADVAIDLGDSVELDGLVSIPPGQISTVLWTPEQGLNCQECYTTVSSATADICYVFAVTDTTNCTARDTVCVFVSTPTHSSNLEVDHPVSLYPNPTSDQLIIEADAKDTSGAAIYDASGAVISRTTFSNGRPQIIDVSSLPNGIYYLRIKFKDRFGTGKFIKRG